MTRSKRGLDFRKWYSSLDCRHDGATLRRLTECVNVNKFNELRDGNPFRHAVRSRTEVKV